MQLLDACIHDVGASIVYIISPQLDILCLPKEGDLIATKMQSHKRFEDTPYLLDEIMAARAELKQRFGPYTSQALLTLQRKCFFAVQGPQHRNQRSSFTNECFTTIELQCLYPDIPENQLRLTRDSGDSAQPGDSGLPSDGRPEVVIDLTQESDASSSPSSTQIKGGPPNSGSNKRKLEDDQEPCHSMESLEPPRKRLQQAGASHPHVDPSIHSSAQIMRWKCDLCRIMTTKKPLMNRHLAKVGHLSASLVRCQRVAEGLNPVMVVAPAAMKNPLSFGKNLIPVCPYVSCNEVFGDIYACSKHYSCVHNSQAESTTHLSTNYSLGHVLQEDKIFIHSGRTCTCGKTFKRRTILQTHILQCKTSFESCPLKTFMAFICPQCSKGFTVFFRASQHVIKCWQNHRAKTDRFVRVLHVGKAKS